MIICCTNTSKYYNYLLCCITLTTPQALSVRTLSNCMQLYIMLRKLIILNSTRKSFEINVIKNLISKFTKLSNVIYFFFVCKALRVNILAMYSTYKNKIYPSTSSTECVRTNKIYRILRILIMINVMIDLFICFNNITIKCWKSILYCKSTFPLY